MGKRARSERAKSKNKPGNSGAPLDGARIGSFTGTSVDIIEICSKVEDAALRGVEAGSRLTRDALEPKPIARWIIAIYILILFFAFAVVLIPKLSDYRQMAIGYIFGQIPLLFKSYGLKAD